MSYTVKMPAGNEVDIYLYWVYLLFQEPVIIVQWIDISTSSQLLQRTLLHDRKIWKIFKNFSLPVFGSSLAVLGFVFSFVFIGSQPQTPPLQANLAESRMQSNTVWFFSHLFDNHFVGQALYALVNLWTTLKFVGVLQVLRVTSATFAPVESYINKENGTHRNNIVRVTWNMEWHGNGSSSTRQTFTMNSQVVFLHNGPEASF